MWCGEHPPIVARMQAAASIDRPVAGHRLIGTQRASVSAVLLGADDSADALGAFPITTSMARDILTYPLSSACSSLRVFVLDSPLLVELSSVTISSQES